jgi:hypothetical protein
MARLAELPEDNGLLHSDHHGSCRKYQFLDEMRRARIIGASVE